MEQRDRPGGRFFDRRVNPIELDRRCEYDRLIREPLLSGQAVQVEVPVSLVDLDLDDVRVWALLQPHLGPVEVKLSVGDVASHEVDVDEHSFFGSAVDQGAIFDGWDFGVGLDLVL